MSECKPCPFCGGQDMTYEESDWTPQSWIVCTKCHAEGPIGPNDRGAWELWDRRAGDLTPLTDQERAVLDAAYALAEAQRAIACAAPSYHAAIEQWDVAHTALYRAISALPARPAEQTSDGEQPL